MKNKSPQKRAAYKFGANRCEPARRWRKTAANFKQTRDVREDRGTRQSKSVVVPATLPALESAPPFAKKRHHA
jgi:hypothetical protein